MKITDWQCTEGETVVTGHRHEHKSIFIFQHSKPNLVDCKRNKFCVEVNISKYIHAALKCELIRT